jgi:hypothetical protein
VTDLSVIAEQIEHISRVANGWCNFALVCGCIGFALSVVAAILLIKKTGGIFQKGKTISIKNIKEENDGTVNSDIS